eukprot:tig00021234_g19400.t1
MDGLTPEENEAFEARRKHSDMCSARIAEKMLQRWALLNEQCPAGCPVPLVRNKQGERFCVSCNAFVREDGGASPSAPAPAPAPAPSAPQPAMDFKDEKRRRVLTDEFEAAPPVAARPSPVAEPSRAVSSLLSDTRTPIAPSRATQGPAQAVGSGTPVRSAAAMERSRGLEAALDALVQKLDLYTRALKTATDPSELQIVCSAMADIGRALHALQRVDPSLL